MAPQSFDDSPVRKVYKFAVLGNQFGTMREYITQRHDLWGHGAFEEREPPRHALPVVPIIAMIIHYLHTIAHISWLVLSMIGYMYSNPPKW